MEKITILPRKFIMKNLFRLSDDSVTISIAILHDINNDYNRIITRFDFRHDNGYKSNRNCSMFLGVHIAEQILSKIFENVEVMPIGNPGYDFICNNGYKIDVKSSCLHGDGLWSFDFSKNKIADYFLCLAFDNRENLEPKYMWLLPSNIVNNLTGTSISKSTLNKWKEYVLPINKVISCCNLMKNESDSRH